MVIIFIVIFLSLIFKLSCYKLELRRLWQTIVGQGTRFPIYYGKKEMIKFSYSS